MYILKQISNSKNKTENRRWSPRANFIAQNPVHTKHMLGKAMLIMLSGNLSLTSYITASK